MKDINIWKFIYEQLSKNKKVILVTVLSSQGSSPGKAGFKMAVVADGSFIGTIGGGEMENKILNQCKKYLSPGKKFRIIEKLYHSKKVNKLQSGLICAGAQTNFICSLDKSDIKTIYAILKTYESNQTGILKIAPNGISLANQTRNKNVITFDYKSENEWNYEENIGVCERIYIAGGGHVGLALARQMELLGFYITVFDDRTNVQTIKENKFADEIIITDYDKVGDFIEDDADSYAAIVTSSHPTDKIVLKQLLNKKLKYIGLMGSSAKIRSIYNQLISEGVKPAQLKKIKAPIGIDINSETVSEIAVSIAGEIIKIKNRNKNKKKNPVR